MAEIKPPQSAEELLQRYGDGERNFRRADLYEADLQGANLENANLSEANLGRSNLVGANLKDANLSEANLNRVYLERTSRYILENTNLEGADLSKANLEGADLSRANLTDTNLKGVNLEGANLRGALLTRSHLIGANLVGADLSEASFSEANLVGAKLSEANLERAYLPVADLRGASLTDSNLDSAILTDVAFSWNADLLTAKWITLIIGNKTYHRDAVERGEEILPFGMGPRLSVIIETARLNGLKHDATMGVVDQLAKAGIEAKLEQVGGAGSIIRFSVRSHDDAELLLYVGDGMCRLLGIGTGIENLLPAATRATTKRDLDEGLAIVARQQNAMLEHVFDTLERIGREDLKSVKLSGFTDKQMEKLRSVIDEVSDLLEVKFIEESREAMMTLTQKVTRDVYEMKVARPLRTLLEAVFNP